MSCGMFATMVRRSLLIALTAVLAAVLAGCGTSSLVALQDRVIAYQDTLGTIDKPFARPTASTAHAEALLRRAIGQYERLRPPPKLRADDAAALRGLRGELRSITIATRAVAAHDSAALSAAEAADLRAQRTVAGALRRITRYAGACRTNAAQC